MQSFTTLRLHLQHVKELFLDYFSSDHNFDYAAGPLAEDVNTEDVNITSKSGNFNVETGMWDYPSLSQHKPMDMHNIQLVHSTKMRNSASIQENEVFILKPDGSLKKFQCGERYCEEELAGVATLSIRIGAIQCNSCNITYSNGTCKINFHEAAAEKGYFLFYQSHSSRRQNWLRFCQYGYEDENIIHSLLYRNVQEVLHQFCK